jgi:hypothetical protein
MTPEEIAAINAAFSSSPKPSLGSKRISEEELLRMVAKLPPEIRVALFAVILGMVAVKLTSVLHLERE